MDTASARPSRRERLLNAAPLLLALVFCVPALAALWQPGLQHTDDGLHHLFRLFNLDLALRAGHPGARWLADEGFGYGFPVLNFYAPLNYYFGLIFHFMGAGYATALELALAAGLLLSAASMFWFARDLVGPWGGGVAAVAYLWAPYHLADAWTRGALGELLAFVWFPLLLLAMLRIARGHGRARFVPALGGALALAGLTLTHNVSLLLIGPVLLAWGVFLLAVEKGDRRGALAGYAVMGLLGVALSAVYWLPALAETRLVLAGNTDIGMDGWLWGLVPLRRLLADGWMQNYSIAPGAVSPYPLGWAQVVAAGAGAGVGVWRWRALNRTARYALPLFAGLALGALLLQWLPARPLWETLPGMLLLLFPFRWQAVAALALAVVTGYAGLAAGVPTRAVRPWLGAAVMTVTALALMSSALPGLPWRPAVYPTSDEQISDANVNRRTMALYDYGRGLWIREHGDFWLFEYMPVDALPVRDRWFVSAGPEGEVADAPALTAQATPGQQRPLERRFTVDSAAPWTMQLHQFYFPGWQATVDGKRVPVQPVGELALVGAALPAGKHEVTFRFAATPTRAVGALISLAGLGALAAGLIWLGRWRWLAAGAGAALLLAAVLLLRAQSEPTALTPQPLAVNFGHQARLAGYSLEEVRPGGESAVTLNWLALDRPQTDYKVFLHLVDQNGQLWAQHDGEPGYFFSPTTRWQPGEMVDDRHELVWRESETPPPGRYLLFAGLYDPASGQRLAVLDENGQPLGDQTLLAEIDLP